MWPVFDSFVFSFWLDGCPTCVFTQVCNFHFTVISVVTRYEDTLCLSSCFFVSNSLL